MPSIKTVCAGLWRWSWLLGVCLLACEQQTPLSLSSAGTTPAIQTTSFVGRLEDQTEDQSEWSEAAPLEVDEEIIKVGPDVTTITNTLSPFNQELAKDTWTYLTWATTNHLPWSWKSETLTGGDYANPAEMGLYALAWLAAYDMGESWSPEWAETEAEVTAVLSQLRAWQTGSQTQQPHGLNAYNHSVFYQWYWISWTPPVVGENAGKNQLVPSIDNAWLALSLITIREYAEANDHLEFAQKADAILADMDFTLWYDADNHLFYLGDIQNPIGGNPGDYYSNENRIINFVARALNQLDAHEFEQSLSAMAQPSGTYKEITVNNVSWDGSYFTYASPALFIREMPTFYGSDTINPATQAQIDFADEQQYTAWGLSDAFDTGDGEYLQQGALPIAAPLSSSMPEVRPGLISPHATALALITAYDDEANANLQLISNAFDCAYDDNYGYRDSMMVNPDDDEYSSCSNRFSALAQLWIFLSLANYRNGFIWENLYQDENVTRTHLEMYGIYQLYLPFAVR